MFLKRHKWLSVLFAISVVLIIKNSSIPYIGTPWAGWAFIFDQPETKFAIELMNLIEVFAVAYSTSLIFYYMVSFRPAMQQEKESLKIIGSKPVIHDYNLVETGSLYKSNVLTECNAVMNTPSFMTCDEKLRDIISQLILSEGLSKFPNANDKFVANGIYMERTGFGRGYQELCEIKNAIGSYVAKKIDSKLIDATEAEIEKWRDDNITLMKENPEIASVIAQIQKVTNK